MSTPVEPPDPSLQSRVDLWREQIGALDGILGVTAERDADFDTAMLVRSTSSMIRLVGPERCAPKELRPVATLLADARARQLNELGPGMAVNAVVICDADAVAPESYRICEALGVELICFNDTYDRLRLAQIVTAQPEDLPSTHPAVHGDHQSDAEQKAQLNAILDEDDGSADSLAEWNLELVAESPEPEADVADVAKASVSQRRGVQGSPHAPMPLTAEYTRGADGAPDNADQARTRRRAVAGFALAALALAGWGWFNANSSAADLAPASPATTTTTTAPSCITLEMTWERLWDALHYENAPYGEDGHLYFGFTNSGDGTGHRIFTVHLNYVPWGQAVDADELIHGEWIQGYSPQLCGLAGRVDEVADQLRANAAASLARP